MKTLFNLTLPYLRWKSLSRWGFICFSPALIFFVLNVIISITCITVNATTSVDFWAKIYSYEENKEPMASSIKQTIDGGYVIVGRIKNHHVGLDSSNIWILKLDNEGEIDWQKTYNTDFHSGESIIQTADNGYLVAGLISFNDNPKDIWVIKLDSNGNIVWQKTYGSNDVDSAGSSECLQKTPDGGFIIAGITSSFGIGDLDTWVLKLDMAGNVIWEKTYGGSERESPKSIQLTSDGGYIVAGVSQTVFPVGNRDFWVMKLDNNGNIIWQKTYGEDGWNGAFSIKQTADGGYIVGGSLEPFPFLLKLDSEGNVAWQKTYNINGSSGISSVQQTDDDGDGEKDDGYTALGIYSFASIDGTWILKLDSSGNITWVKTYKKNNQYLSANSLLQISDEGYIVLGKIEGGSNDDMDILMLKLDSTGDIFGCDLIGTTDVTVDDPLIVVENSNATALPTSAIITDINIILQDFTGESSVICCYNIEDNDCDGLLNTEDNCPDEYNSNQDDNYPPQGNSCGDACDCEGDFDCDEDCDGGDAAEFKLDFGRSNFGNPCTNENQCHGDFDCDVDVDGTDAVLFKEDFGRSSFNDPCPACVVGEWCNY